MTDTVSTVGDSDVHVKDTMTSSETPTVEAPLPAGAQDVEGVRKGNRRTCLQKQLKKTKMCVQLGKGHCRYGDACSYAHCFSELQGMPNLQGTKICKNYSQNGTCDDPNCGFAHGDDELKTTQVFYKTVLCTWHENGTCRGGDQCRFAHGVDDLRSAEVDHSKDDEGVAAHGLNKDGTFTQGGSGNYAVDHGGCAIRSSLTYLSSTLPDAPHATSSCASTSLDTLPFPSDVGVPRLGNIWETAETTKTKQKSNKKRRGLQKKSFARTGDFGNVAMPLAAPPKETDLSQPLYLNAALLAKSQLLAGQPALETPLFPSDSVSSNQPSEPAAQFYVCPEQGYTGRFRGQHQKPPAVDAKRRVQESKRRVDLGVTHDQMSYSDARRIFSPSYHIPNDAMLPGQDLSGGGLHSQMQGLGNLSQDANSPPGLQPSATVMLRALATAIECSRLRIQGYMDVLEVAQGQEGVTHNEGCYVPASVPHFRPSPAMPDDFARSELSSSYSHLVPMKLPCNGFEDDQMLEFSPNMDNMLMKVDL